MIAGLPYLATDVLAFVGAFLVILRWKGLHPVQCQIHQNDDQSYHAVKSI